MKLHKWKDIKNRPAATAAEAAEADRIRNEIVEETTLRELREMTGMTQAELAAKLEATQSHLSQVEAQDDLRLSTLRRYVKALGGEVHLRAELNGRTFDLVI
jgi:DNA-binding XRE family transcriptional regulator